MTRPTIDYTLMGIAYLWEQRSSCSRNHVGAVIAMNGRHIGSGYNGAPSGMAHCEHITPTLEHNPLAREVIDYAWPSTTGCKIAIHAEANALAYCARDGISVQGATLYTTLSPCYACSQLIIAAGLIRVVYGRPYRVMDGVLLLESAGVMVEKMV
jgi:dCMP deaminase